MKIVLDTNVLIAAFISPGGICNEIFEILIRNHSLVSSEFIISELEEKLELKFGFGSNDISDIIDIIISKAMMVKIKGNKINICRDKDDNNIIETADIAKANMIISGDKDLLVLKKYKSIDIFSPRQFYNMEKGIS